MKQIPIANWKVPKAASSVVRPSQIRGATQLMFVSAGNIYEICYKELNAAMRWEINTL
jgi:hypothetical protein